MKEADEAVVLSARRTASGKVDVNQDVDRVNSATGDEIDEIG